MVSESVGWGKGRRICISNKFPGVGDATGPMTTLLNATDILEDGREKEYVQPRFSEIVSLS